MRRSTCPQCSAPVIVVELSGEDGSVVLDPHEAALGPGRFAVWDDGSARPVAAGAQVLAHTVHQCSRGVVHR